MIVYKIVSVDMEGRRHSFLARDEYKTEYPKGRTLNIKGFGAMCFKRRMQAETFIDYMDRSCTVEIIRIKPLCRATKIKYWTTCFRTDNIKALYKSLRLPIERGRLWGIVENLKDSNPHEGTLCYKKIKVID